MKLLEKIALIIYSYIILILSVVTGLLIIGWLEPSLVQKVTDLLLNQNIASKITLGVNVIFILLSIKCIFFSSNSTTQSKEKQGILLKNDNGKLMITKETIENLTNSVVKEFENIEETTSKINVDQDNNLSIVVSLVVKSNTIIKELTVKRLDKS